jgi:hypothetical protein
MFDINTFFSNNFDQQNVLKTIDKDPMDTEC